MNDFLKNPEVVKALCAVLSAVALLLSALAGAVGVLAARWRAERNEAVKANAELKAAIKGAQAAW